MLEAAIATRFVIAPLTNIVGAIGPRLRAFTVPDGAEPFSSKDRSTLILVRLPLLPLMLVIDRGVRQRRRFHQLRQSEVLRRAYLLLPHVCVVPPRLISSRP